MPINSNIGFLIVQGYTTESCGTVLREKLNEFFISKEFLPTWGSVIPAAAKKEFIKKCNLYRISVVKKRKEKEDDMKNVLYSSLEQSRRVFNFSNFKLNVSELLKMDGYENSIRDSITELGVDLQEGDEIVLFYNSDQGKAHALLKNAEEIAPTILVDGCLNSATNLPDWPKLAKFIENYLVDLKKQIGYNHD